MLLPAGGDVVIQLALFADLDVAGAAVALDLAIPVLEDVAVRVGVGAAFHAAVIALGRTFWISGRIGRGVIPAGLLNLAGRGQPDAIGVEQ